MAVYNFLEQNLKFLTNIIDVILNDSSLVFQILLISGLFLISFITIFVVSPRIKKSKGFLVQNEKNFIIFILTLCIAISFIWELYFITFTKDDAFITFRYSKNFVNGYGIVFNRDNNPVEGYSNFLWVILSAIPLILRIDIVLYTKIFSILLSFCLILFLYRFTTLFYNKLLSLIGPILYTLYYPFHLWTVACLETPLFILLIVSSFYFSYQEVSNNKTYPLYSIICFFLLALTRPEGIIYYGSFELVLIIVYGFMLGERKIIVQRLFSLITVGSLYLIYFIWRVNYYGYLLPNSYYAKGSSLITITGIEYVFFFLIFSAPIIIFALSGIYKTIRNRKDFRNLIFLLPPILVNFLITLNIEKFLTAQGFRYLLPSVPFILILSVGFFKGINLNRNTKSKADKKIQSRLIIRGLPILILLLLIYIPSSAPLVHKNITFNDVNHKHYLLGQWFDSNVPSNATVAYVDMGIVPFYCDLNFIDMWGLMDEHIAQEGFTPEYVLSKEPTFIIFRLVVNFEGHPELEAKYDKFFTVFTSEITQYLEYYEVALTIYKLKQFEITNSSLEMIFKPYL